MFGTKFLTTFLSFFSIGIFGGVLGFGGEYLLAQEEKKAFDVTLAPENLYAFDALQYRGDYIELTASNGQMLLGTIEKGTTVVILLTAGNFKVSAPPEFEDKVKQAFDAYPAAGKFSRAYIRMRPEDYEAMTSGAKLTKIQDEKIFNRGKEVYGEKFLGSYHAGDKATLPPERSIFVDLETEAFGQVIIEDGYWLRMVRITPYKSIFPRGFVKPRKKA